MRKFLYSGLLCLIFLSLGFRAEAQDNTISEDIVSQRLLEAGFLNLRSSESEKYRVYTIETDYYKIPVDALEMARGIIEHYCDSSDARPVKLIVTRQFVPEITMTYYTLSKSWRTTRKLDSSWKDVKKAPLLNSSIAKASILVYPQVSFKNLIINQIYHSLWQLSPALEVSLWPGMKFTYQLKIPVYNDGYGEIDGRLHPGMISLSQRFRDPFGWNFMGKATVGCFSNNRYGAALELEHWLPNERFSIDTQLAFLGVNYWNGFKLFYERQMNFYWNVAFNYFNPALQTQFTLRAQKFLLDDVGLKYEMIRHFRHCSVGLYAEKGRIAQLNVGFRFQISLPPFGQKRHGYMPKISTSGQMGISYNANNERLYYKEFRTEASDNIMQRNYYNPYYIDYQLSK